MSIHTGRRLLTAAMLALGLPLAAHAQPAAKPIELNVLPLPNTHQQLDTQMRIEVRMNMLPKADASEEERQKIAAAMAQMPSPMLMRSQITQRLDTGPADKQGRIEVKSEVVMGKSEMQMGPGGPVKAVPVPMGNMRFSAVLNQGRYEQVKFSEPLQNALPGVDVNAMFGQFFNAMAPLQGAKLTPGEFVEIPLPLAMPLPGLDAAAMDGKMVARYTLRKVDKGVADFDIDARLDMQINADVPAPAPSASAASAPAAAPIGFKLKAKGEGKGQMRLRLADRLQLSNTLDMSMQMDMPLPDGNQMQMNMRMQMALKGQPAKKR